MPGARPDEPPTRASRAARPWAAWLSAPPSLEVMQPVFAGPHPRQDEILSSGRLPQGCRRERRGRGARARTSTFVLSGIGLSRRADGPSTLALANRFRGVRRPLVAQEPGAS